MDIEIDIAADYRTLLENGIVIWPELGDPRDWFDLEFAYTSVYDPIETWSSDLVALAKADGLHAARFWFHDLWYTWPCIKLCRPDGSAYPSAGGWKRSQQPPLLEPSARILKPLIERDWAETLTTARQRLAKPGSANAACVTTNAPLNSTLPRSSPGRMLRMRNRVWSPLKNSSPTDQSGTAVAKLPMSSPFSR